MKLVKDPIELASVSGFVMSLVVPHLVEVPPRLVDFVVLPSSVAVPVSPAIVDVLVAPAVTIAAMSTETLKLMDARALESKVAVNSSGQNSVFNLGKENDKDSKLLMVVISLVTEQPCVVLCVVLHLDDCTASGRTRSGAVACCFVEQVDSSDFLFVS